MGSMSQHFDEANVRRSRDGKFAEKPVIGADAATHQAAATAAAAEASTPTAALPAAGATAHEARFDGHRLDRRELPGNYAFCSFRGADLTRSDLTGKQVGNTFTGAALTGARLGSSVGNDYSEADLTGAYSFRSVHQDATFKDAHLTGSTWVSCSFWGADLSEAHGVDAAQFHDCAYDATTRFPAGYEPADNGWVRRDPPAGYQAAVTRARGAAATGDLSGA